MKKRQYGCTIVAGSRELAIPPVIISAASSLKFIAGFSAHHMYRREKALWPAKNSKPAGQQGSTVLEASGYIDENRMPKNAALDELELPIDLQLSILG